MKNDRPNTHRPFDINHPTHPEVAKKFSFFGDSLGVVNMKAGEYGWFEVESHLTLFESLLYFVSSEIDNNSPTFAGFTLSQVQYILKTHPLASSTDFLIQKYYSTVLPHFAVIQSQVQPYIPALVQVKTELEQILKILEQNYVENIVRGAAQLICCKHKLKKHLGGFEYWAKLLFTHFHITNGYARTDIASFVRQLLEKTVERDGDRIYIDSPIPTPLRKKLTEHNVTEAAFKQELFDEISNYFEKRNVFQQVEGLLSLAEREKYHYSFLFRVHGIYMREDELEIHGIKFTSTHHFKKVNKPRLKFDDVKQFLIEPSAIVEYSAPGLSQDEALRSAIQELKLKLDRIGFLTGKRLLLNPSHYLVHVKNQDIYWLNDNEERSPLDTWDADIVLERDKLINVAAYNAFLNDKESILVAAAAEENVNMSLHGYSKFIEQISKHSMNGLGDGSVGKKNLAFAYLLLGLEQHQSKRDMARWAYNVINNSDACSLDATGFTLDDHKDFSRRKIIPSISEMYSRFKHAHTRFRLRKITKRTVQSDIDAFYYYVRFTVYLTKYRNLGEHLNSTEERLARKLKLSAHSLCVRVLQAVIRELRKPVNAIKTAAQIVKEMIHRGEIIAQSSGALI